MERIGSLYYNFNSEIHYIKIDPDQYNIPDTNIGLYYINSKQKLCFSTHAPKIKNIGIDLSYPIGEPSIIFAVVPNVISPNETILPKEDTDISTFSRKYEEYTQYRKNNFGDVVCTRLAADAYNELADILSQNQVKALYINPRFREVNRNVFDEDNKLLRKVSMNELRGHIVLIEKEKLLRTRQTV